MTKREFLENVLNIAGLSDEMVEFAQNELAKMDNRNAARKAKPSKVAVENAAHLQTIQQVLDGQDPMTAAQIAEVVNLSTAKVTSICSRAARDNVLGAVKVKSTSKSGGKVNAYFVPATADEAE